MANENVKKNTHTPEEVANSIKDIIKKQRGSLNTYAQERNITPTQLYSLLNGKKYLSFSSAFRFYFDFDINIDYCTDGNLPILDPDHDYTVLLDAATDFYEAVMKEDKIRDLYESQYDNFSSEEREQFKKELRILRIDKLKKGCVLVDVLNDGWGEENDDDKIKKQPIPKNTMKLHEAIQEVIRNSGKALTFTEIAEKINSLGLYNRKDGQPIPASQISARVKNYPHLFTVNSDTYPKTITIK